MMSTQNAAQPAANAGGKIELKRLCKRYSSNSRLVVDHVDLQVEAGEFLTLLGPSGSGKTTALNMIAGIVDVTSGSILVNGKDVSRIPPNRRDFGMVFQSYALFPHMTVAENIAFPLRQRRMRSEASAELVSEMLKLMDLEGLGSRRPQELSGGQQQRVALARALVFSPSVLLLDEPLGALDRKLRQSLQFEIKRLHRQLGLTFIFVTHDQDEAMFLSDRIAVFNEGRIEAFGPPAELYNNPQTLFVAKFLGESNVFRGQLNADRIYVWQGNQWALSSTQSPASDSVLVVRPERLQVFGPGSAVPDGLNSVRANILSSAHLGMVCRLDVEFEGGGRGCALLSPDLAATIGLGSAVTLAWRLTDQAFVHDSASRRSSESTVVSEPQTSSLSEASVNLPS